MIFFTTKGVGGAMGNHARASNLCLTSPTPPFVSCGNVVSVRHVETESVLRVLLVVHCIHTHTHIHTPVEA